jgi:hypothetical protein
MGIARFIAYFALSIQIDAQKQDFAFQIVLRILNAPVKES